MDKQEISSSFNSFIKANPSLKENRLIIGTPEELFGDRADQVETFAGAYLPKDKIVIINSEAEFTREGLEKTFRHELIGHAGINFLAPEEKKTLLTAIDNSKDKELGEIKKIVDETYPEKAPLIKAEEVYALVAEKPHKAPNYLAVNEEGMTLKELSGFIGIVENGIKENRLKQQTFPEGNDAQFQRKWKEKVKKPPLYEEVATKLIKQLEEGTAPWQKPWEAGTGFMPYNPTTGNRYKGLNTVSLAMQGYSDPRWMTYKQAVDQEAQVRRGEKGTRIEYYKFEDEKIKKDESGKPVLDSEGNKVKIKIRLEKPKVFTASVFNAEQIDGLPPLEKKEPSWEESKRAEKILQGSPVTINNDQADRAFYRPSTDSIHLPPKNQFDAEGKYYATALHELGHSTGHPSRLDRDLSGGFGSESYAKEELRAEISSLMVGDEIGTGHDPSQHTAYVKSWVKILKEAPKEIFEASKDAEKIKTEVLSYEQQAEKSNTQEPGTAKTNPDPLALKLAEKIAGQFESSEDQARFLEQVKAQLEQTNQNNIDIKLKEKQAINNPEEDER
jgi:antirestriction protein ArdC